MRLFIPPGQDLGRYSAFVDNATLTFNVNCVGVPCNSVKKIIMRPLSFGLTQSHVLDCQALGDSLDADSQR